MEISTLFEIAFRDGCGLDLEQQLTSQTYARELLLARQVVTRRAVQAEAEGYRMSPRDAASRIQNTALLRLLGRGLVAACGRYLSRRAIASAKVLDRLSDEKAFLSVQAVLREIRCAPRMSDTAVDILSQSRFRVMPLTWTNLAEDPNCIGRVMLAACWLERAGAKLCYRMPIETYGDVVTKRYVQCVKLLQAELEQLEYPVAHDFQTSLGDAVADHARRAELPDYLHLGVVGQFPGARQVYLDPNFFQGGVFDVKEPLRRQMLRCINVLEVHHFPDEGIVQVPELAEGLERYLEFYRRALEQFRGSRGTVEDLARSLTDSGVIEELLKSDAFLKPTKKRLRSVSGIARGRKLLELLAQRKQRMLKILVQVGDCAEPAGFEGTFCALLELGFIPVADTYCRRNSNYITWERGDLYLALGCAALSQISLDFGLGEQVERRLFRIWPNQYRMLYQAAAPLRSGGPMTEDAAYARCVLKKLPVRLATADRVLAQLASMFPEKEELHV